MRANSRPKVFTLLLSLNLQAILTSGALEYYISLQILEIQDENFSKVPTSASRGAKVT